MSANPKPETKEWFRSQASKIWLELAEMDRSEPLREELRRAKIAEQRIRSLYPVQFTDFIAGLQSRITVKTLAGITAPVKLEESMDSMRWLLSELPTIDQEFKHMITVKHFTNELADFMRHIYVCLPAELAGEEDRAETARRAGILLWLTIAVSNHVLTANTDGRLDDLEEESNWLLVTVAKQLLKD